MIVFHSRITLPDAGVQERDHEEYREMKLYLIACANMGASPDTLHVSVNGRDITREVFNDVSRTIAGARARR